MANHMVYAPRGAARFGTSRDVRLRSGSVQSMAFPGHQNTSKHAERMCHQRGTGINTPHAPEFPFDRGPRAVSALQSALFPRSEFLQFSHLGSSVSLIYYNKHVFGWLRWLGDMSKLWPTAYVQV